MQLEGVAHEDGTVRELREFLEAALPGSDLDPTLGFSVDMTRGLLAKEEDTTLALMPSCTEDGEAGTVRGWAIYAKASMFNNDFLPSACWVKCDVDKGGDCNTDIVIRALHDIEQGTEICLCFYPMGRNGDYSSCGRREEPEVDYQCQRRCQRCKVSSQCKIDRDEREADAEQSATEGKPNDKGEERDMLERIKFAMKFLFPVEQCGGTMVPFQPGELDREGLKGPMECKNCKYNLVRSQEKFLHNCRHFKNFGL